MAWENLSINWTIDRTDTGKIGYSANSNKVDFYTWGYYGTYEYGKATMYIDLTNIQRIAIKQTQRIGNGASDLYFGAYNSSSASNHSYKKQIQIDNTNGSRTIYFDTSDIVGSWYVGFRIYINTYDGSSGSRIDFSSIQVDRVPSYTVSLTAGTGINSVNGAGTYTSGKEVSISATASSGYKFSKWTGSTETSDNPYKFTINENKSFTANAIANIYTVTFNPNEGSISTTQKTVTYNSKYGDLPIPSRTGHTFNGWYTAITGGTQVTKDTVYKVVGNQTLYAQWTINKYTVTLNPNGGTVSPSSISVQYNNTYGTLPIPTRDNYKFLGWYTTATGGTQITSSTKYTTANDTTLYAQWQSNGTVRIKIDGVFKLAQVFIYNNGTWHLTQPSTWISNEWKLNGG